MSIVIAALIVAGRKGRIVRVLIYFKKTCKIHGELRFSDCVVVKNTRMRIGICFLCNRCVSARQRNYYKKNTDKARERTRKWQKKNKERYNNSKKKYWHKISNNMSDNFIITKLKKNSQLTTSDITPELIELTRASIKLKRMIKDKKGKL